MAAIDLPYIEKNRSRHGRMRYFFRFEGVRHARLPDDPDSEEFSKAYWKARNALETGEQAAPAGAGALPGHPKPGTFRALCVAYLGSDKFKQLDATTRAKRRAIIDGMMLEPIKPPKSGDPGDPRLFADMPLLQLTVDNLTVLRDRKRDTPFAADERLKVLGQIFETEKTGRDGKPVKIMPLNTASLVRRFRAKSDGHHTIRGHEIAQYIRHHGIRSKAVFALILLMYTGFRVSDAAAVGPQHRQRDALVLRLFKNRNRHPVTLTVPIHPVLDLVMSWHPVKGLTYLRTEFDRAFSVKGLGNRISDWMTQADLPHCTAHSVRKGLATNIAENEATDSMMDGFFGWKDAKTSRIYTQKKQQAKLARQALARINWEEIENLLPHPGEGVEIPGDQSQENVRKING